MLSKIFEVGQTGFRHEHVAMCRGSTQGTRTERGKVMRTGKPWSWTDQTPPCHLLPRDLEQVISASHATHPPLAWRVDIIIFLIHRISFRWARILRTCSAGPDLWLVVSNRWFLLLCCSRSWQTSPQVKSGPLPIRCHWDEAILICLRIVCGFFHAIVQNEVVKTETVRSTKPLPKFSIWPFRGNLPALDLQDRDMDFCISSLTSLSWNLEQVTSSVATAASVIRLFLLKNRSAKQFMSRRFY